MIDGPSSAPSSPPEMPAPTKLMPVSRTAFSRRIVSVNRALPPSTMMSPGSNTFHERVDDGIRARAGLDHDDRGARLRAATPRTPRTWTPGRTPPRGARRAASRSSRGCGCRSRPCCPRGWRGCGRGSSPSPRGRRRRCSRSARRHGIRAAPEWEPDASTSSGAGAPSCSRRRVRAHPPDRSRCSSGPTDRSATRAFSS